MALRRTTAPAVEPITLDEAKAHLRVDHVADDALISELIGAARQYVEDWTGRALVEQTWQLELDAWPIGQVIYLPRPRAIGITSVKYIDGDGVQQTLGSGNYVLDEQSEPARLFPPYGVDWPSVRDQRGAIEIIWTAGYGANAAAVPDGIKAAVKLVLDHLYARDPVRGFPSAVPALLSPYWHGRIVGEAV